MKAAWQGEQTATNKRATRNREPCRVGARVVACYREITESRLRFHFSNPRRGTHCYGRNENRVYLNAPDDLLPARERPIRKASPVGRKKRQVSSFFPLSNAPLRGLSKVLINRRRSRGRSEGEWNAQRPRRGAPRRRGWRVRWLFFLILAELDDWRGSSIHRHTRTHATFSPSIWRYDGAEEGKWD